MRLEHLPLLLGLLFVVAGVALIADALLREQPLMVDRRKRSRPQRHRGGQVAIGIGTLAVAAALFGRDGWRYGTVAVMLGVVAFGIGVWLNWAYVRDFMLGPEPRVVVPDEPESRPMKRRARVPVDREVPTPAVAGDLVGGVNPEIEPVPPRTSVPPNETRRLQGR
jgi:hypothetical protein